MRRVFGFLLASGFLLLGTGIGTYADLAKPKASPAPSIVLLGKPVAWANLTIEPDPKGYDARLQISQSALNDLRAALAEPPENRSTAQTIIHSSPRTIVAGLSLFVAISMGGIWLVRSGSNRGQKALAAALISMAVLTAAAMITRANGAPPSYRWRVLTQNLAQGKPTKGVVTVEVVAEGEGMKLILPVPPARTTDE